MNKYITKENIYNRGYKKILITHSKAYKKYNELKYEEDDNKRGIVLYNSNSLKRDKKKWTILNDVVFQNGTKLTPSHLNVA